MPRSSPTRPCGKARSGAARRSTSFVTLDVMPAGLQDPLLDEVLPGLAGDGLDQLARDRVEDVVVGESASGSWSRASGSGCACTRSARLISVRRDEHQVALAQAEPAAVRRAGRAR